MEYASTVWDPSTEQLQHKLDMVQNGAIQFIFKLKRRDSVTEALEKLDVQTLGDRRKISRRNLLLKLLSSEDSHGPLIDSYDEQMTIKTCIPVTRAAERGDPPTIYAKSSVYHNSFCQKLSENSRLTFLSSPNYC